MRTSLISLSFLLFFTSILAQPEWRMFRAPEQINDFHDFGSYFWLATNAGVIELNKTTFGKTRMTSLNSSLPSDNVSTVTVDKNGNTWIGTDNAVIGMWDGNDFVNVIDINEQFANANITGLHALAFDDNNVMWVGTSYGLVRFDGTNWEIFNLATTSEFFLIEVWDITFDNSGNVFVASLHNYKFDGNNWTDLNDVAPIESTSGGFWFRLDENDIWYSNLKNGIVHFDGSNWRSWTLENVDDWFSNSPNSAIKGVIHHDVLGYVLMTKSDGIYQLQNGAWLENSAADFEDVSLFFSDNTGGYWLNRRNRFGSVTNWNLTETNLSQYKLESNIIRKIAQNESGHIYVVNDYDDISYFDGTFWKTFVTPFGSLQNMNINDFLFDINDPNDIWVASNHGLWMNDNATGWSQVTSNGLSSNINDLEIDSNGDLYVAHLEGLSILTNGNWTHFNGQNSPLDNQIYQIKVDGNGSIFVPMENAIFKYDGTDWTKFDHTNSPMSSSYLPMFDIDTDDNLWIRHPQDGLLKYDGSDWTLFNTSNSGILSDEIHNIMTDSDGKIYVSSQLGISIFDGINWQILNHEDHPFYETYQIDLFKDATGHLWIGQSDEGLFVYHSDGVTVNTKERFTDLNIQVYPNPTSGILNIEWKDSEINKIEKIELLNVDGQVIQKSILGNSNKLYINSLSNGIYFLKIKTDGGLFVEKVIKE